MSINKYNVIRFVLDTAYPDAVNNVPIENTQMYWKKWLSSVTGMFRKHQAPLALLRGLKDKNNALLSVLCDQDIHNIENRQLTNTKRIQAINQLKHERYIRSQEKAKRLVEEKQRKKADEAKAALAAKRYEYLAREDEIRKKYSEEIMKITQKRNEEYTLYWQRDFE